MQTSEKKLGKYLIKKVIIASTAIATANDDALDLHITRCECQVWNVNEVTSESSLKRSQHR